MVVTEVNKAYYDNALAMLDKKFRPFIDKDVKAEHYFVAHDNGELAGGFGLNSFGHITGLFALKAGAGKDILDNALTIQKDELEMVASVVECIGEALEAFYDMHGFRTVNTEPFDDAIAHPDWDYDAFGRPNVYIMEKKL